MKKNIVIITNGTLPVPPVNGGAVENLLQTFIDLNEKYKNFELVIFSIYNKLAYEKSKSYELSKFVFINTNTISYKYERFFRYLLNRLLGNKFKNQFIKKVLKFKKEFVNTDIILVENNPFYIPQIKKTISKQVGLHLHNDYLNIDKIEFSISILKKTDFVITVSKYIKNRIAELAPTNIKLDVVHNGINLDRFNLPKNKNKEIVILYSGRLQEEKGIKLLIEVFLDILETNCNNIRLLILGGSGFGNGKRTTFINQINALSEKADGKINFTGYIDYDNIHEYYNQADIGVFPSIIAEAFGLTTLEALASGLPVIVSDSGGMHEVINDKCGFIVKRGDNMKTELKETLLKLIIDNNLRSSMSKEAKIQAKNFTDIKFYRSLVKTLNNIE
jgi:spore coat protein SA